MQSQGFTGVAKLLHEETQLVIPREILAPVPEGLGSPLQRLPFRTF
jgi:hypothetical protein